MNGVNPNMRIKQHDSIVKINKKIEFALFQNHHERFYGSGKCSHQMYSRCSNTFSNLFHWIFQQIGSIYFLSLAQEISATTTEAADSRAENMIKLTRTDEITSEPMALAETPTTEVSRSDAWQSASHGTNEATALSTAALGAAVTASSAVHFDEAGGTWETNQLATSSAAHFEEAAATRKTNTAITLSAAALGTVLAASSSAHFEEAGETWQTDELVTSSAAVSEEAATTWEAKELAASSSAHLEEAEETWETKELVTSSAAVSEEAATTWEAKQLAASSAANFEEAGETRKTNTAITLSAAALGTVLATSSVGHFEHATETWQTDELATSSAAFSEEAATTRKTNGETTRSVAASSATAFKQAGTASETKAAKESDSLEEKAGEANKTGMLLTATLDETATLATDMTAGVNGEQTSYKGGDNSLQSRSRGKYLFWGHMDTKYNVSGSVCHDPYRMDTLFSL